jgi:hypothetical protein
MNPLFLGPAPKRIRDSRVHSDEAEQTKGKLMLPPSALALRLGKLLIRMGHKLTHEDPLHYHPGSLA